MLAVSKRLIPASRHISTCLLAPETSVAPTLLKPPCPPKVIVPRVSAETNKPERPRRRYSIGSSLRGWTNNMLASLARCALRCGVMHRLSQPHRFPMATPALFKATVTAIQVARIIRRAGRSPGARSVLEVASSTRTGTCDLLRVDHLVLGHPIEG